MPPQNVPLGQQLAETRLGRTIPEFVAELKAADPGTGWRTIARELRDRTGIHVSYMTVRAWASRDAA